MCVWEGGILCECYHFILKEVGRRQVTVDVYLHRFDTEWWMSSLYFVL